MFEVVAPELLLVRLPAPGAVGPSPFSLRIRPGGAFPSTHSTTRLCLELLAGLAGFLPGVRVLDVGCGSGILGLAAAAWGAAQVVCLDLAPAAASATRRNARENGLENRVLVLQGSTEALRGSFQVILANLPLEVQLAKVSEFQRLSAPGGRLILSGFRESQEKDLHSRYADLGWSLAGRRCKEFRHPELPPGLDFTWVAWELARRA